MIPALMAHAVIGKTRKIVKYIRLCLLEIGSVFYQFAEEQYYKLPVNARRNSALMVFPSLYNTNSLTAMTADGSLIAGTFSRGGTAVRFNQLGVMESVAANVPRLQYDPTTLTPRGYLMEPGATNLWLNSEAITGWSLTNGASSASSGNIVPTGNGVRITWSTGGATTHLCRALVNTILVQNTVYSLSFFVKPVNMQYINCWIFTYEPGVLMSIHYDTVNGAISIGNAGLHTGSVEVLPGGWYKFKFEGFNIRTGASSPFIDVVASPVLGVTNFATPANSGFILTGLQIEAGSFCTSYIRTTGAQQSRLPDQLTFTGLQAASTFGTDQGTVYLNGTVKGKWADLKDAGDVTKYSLYASSIQNIAEATNTTDGTNYTSKAGYRWQHDVRDTFYRDGTPVENPNPATGTYAINKMVIAPQTGPLLLKGLALYPRAISNNEMNQITT